MSDRLLQQLKRHEGFRSQPYRDSVGVLTIGYGTNLQDGITHEEAHSLLVFRLMRSRAELFRAFPHAEVMQDARQDVLVNMVYNMGISRFMTFKRMRAAVLDKDYAQAAREMLDSKWANQVGKRAEELALQMANGAY